MFQRIVSTMSNLVREPRRSAPSTRPTLEQLEDRCMPSAGFMHPMGMPSPAVIAAFRQLVTDFDRSLQQVLSSQTRQQFVANETAMIQLVSMDLARLNMLLSPTGRRG